MPHTSAILLNKLFIDTYQSGWNQLDNKRVLEQGPGGYTGYKSLFDAENFQYSDYDLKDGEECLNLPWEDHTFDVVISNSVFEHDAMFWLSFNELLRVLKPHGLLLITAPSNGAYHTYPWDCWRFYPDSGQALVKWARHSGHKQAALVESFTTEKYQDIWCDYAMVIIKDDQHLPKYAKRMAHNIQWTGITNGKVHGNDNMINYNAWPQDMRTDTVPVQTFPPELLL